MQDQDRNHAQSEQNLPEPSKDDLKHRPIRSFVLRQGRLTVAQQKALDQLLPVFGVPYAPEKIDLDKVFGRKDSLKILEIGFGMGETTAHIARSMPERDFLGAEVHTPGVGSLLKQIGESGLTNLRIIQHDVVDVINHMLADGSLDGVHIFFPDPWHKKRHHKRRLIQAGFVKLLCSKLKPGGYLHVATDWQEYAEWVLEILQAEPLLKNTATNYAEKPAYRPLTKFENRGIKLGHGVWDLIFIRK
ncbi:MAG TPA: tRNA (guanosine(46)-N7)-methyltransferase TrmB [Methylophilaceae bacterium]|nr:tRNA (guanosine(46)-N7)-methyltransferase TrmB [Methylophilaceae bacterium]